MNFLLHRHFAADALGSAAAGVGAMLPDLWRMADRRVRPRPGVDLGTADPLLDEVLAGVAHHVAADARFHRSSSFVEGERAVARGIADAKLRAPRMALFAHVLWELCLDGELLRRQGVERVLAELRRGFVEAGTRVTKAVELHHFERVARTTNERLWFDARFEEIVRGLAAGPWIAGYCDGEGIALRISGVRVRVGLASLDADDRARLGAALDGLAPRARAALDELLADEGYCARASTGCTPRDASEPSA